VTISRRGQSSPPTGSADGENNPSVQINWGQKKQTPQREEGKGQERTSAFKVFKNTTPIQQLKRWKKSQADGEGTEGKGPALYLTRNVPLGTRANVRKAKHGGRGLTSQTGKEDLQKESMKHTKKERKGRNGGKEVSPGNNIPPHPRGGENISRKQGPP